ncbi:TPA: nicotinate-nucleotide diphosphorylase (carboxylating), partial [Neisseria meningitidis]
MKFCPIGATSIFFDKGNLMPSENTLFSLPDTLLRPIVE